MTIKKFTVLNTPEERFWANCSISVSDKKDFGLQTPSGSRKEQILSVMLYAHNHLSNLNNDASSPSFDQSDLICQWIDEGISPFTALPPSYIEEERMINETRKLHGPTDSIFMWALKKGLTTVVKKCWDKNPGFCHQLITTKDLASDKLPMIKISQEGDIALIKLLGSLGLDMNQQDEKGITPIMKARNLETLNALIEFGGQVSIKDNNGNLPLWHWEKNLVSYGKMKKRFDELHIQSIDQAGLVSRLLEEARKKNDLSVYAERLGENGWLYPVTSQKNLLESVVLASGKNSTARIMFKSFLKYQNPNIWDWNEINPPSALGLILMTYQMQIFGEYGMNSYNHNGEYLTQMGENLEKSWTNYKNKFGAPQTFLIPFKAADKLNKLTNSMSLILQKFINDKMYLIHHCSVENIQTLINTKHSEVLLNNTGWNTIMERLLKLSSNQNENEQHKNDIDNQRILDFLLSKKTIHFMTQYKSRSKHEMFSKNYMNLSEFIIKQQTNEELVHNWFDKCDLLKNSLKDLEPSLQDWFKTIHIQAERRILENKIDPSKPNVTTVKIRI